MRRACAHAEHGRAARPRLSGATRRTGGCAGRRARRRGPGSSGPRLGDRVQQLGGGQRPGRVDHRRRRVELVAADAELAEPAGGHQHAVLQGADRAVVGADRTRSASGRAGRGGRPSWPAARAGRGRARGSRGPCRPASAGSRRRRPCAAARSAWSGWPARPAARRRTPAATARPRAPRTGTTRRARTAPRTPGWRAAPASRPCRPACRRAGGAGGRAGRRWASRSASESCRATGGVQERVERHLGVDDDVLAAGEVDHQVGAQQPPSSVPCGHLLGEVAAVHQPGELDDPAQVQLAPAAPDLRLAQRRGQRRRSRGAARRWSAARPRPAA